MSQVFIPLPNDPAENQASLIELESLMISSYACIDDILNLASSEQTTAQALAESVDCDEMWQDILSGQLERDSHVECLTAYLRSVQRGATAAVAVQEAEKALQEALRLLTDDGLRLLDLKRRLGNVMSRLDDEILDDYLLQTAARNDKWDECKGRMDELDQNMSSESIAWSQMQAAGVDQQTLEEREEEYALSHQRYSVERLLLDVELAGMLAGTHDLRLFLKANLGTWRCA